MTDSNNIGVPYNSLSKIRYSEHLDHTALIKRLNDIADDIYRLTGLCNDVETRLSDHNDATDAHRALRESINNVNSRIAGLMTSVDASIAELNTSLETTQTTLTAANNQLSNKVTQLETELADIRAEVENVILSTSTTIVSSVDGAPIIESSANAGNLTLAKIPSTHGSFTYNVRDGKNTVEYTASSNTTGVPNYAATLLDESGNATFPKTVTATAFNGNASSATTSANASKLDHSVTFTLKDATNKTASSVTTDLTGDVTLKLPSILRGTDITGGASYATADSMGANIANTYMHKTNVDETIAGTKTFSGTLRSDTVIPKTHTGSTLGSTSAPYEEIHGTNITGETANIPSITGSLTGNASTATKLVTARQINGTAFDGTTAITTNKWGTARSMNITDASGTNTGGVVRVDGSNNITLKLPSTIKASISGNVSSATKLNTARQINGTAFDGTRNITTAKWGTARNITIATSDGANVGTSVTVDGSGDVTLKLPAIINASMSGNAATATKLKTARTINGTSFDGSADITTAKWGTARFIRISDVTRTRWGGAATVDGSNDVILELPATIKATLIGNADTATEFQNSKSVTLTGDVTGTASSKGGWSVATTLANSGVTAGSYGPTANVTGSNNTTISVPQIKVNAKGLVTSITNRTYTSVDTHYTTMMYAGAKTTQDNDASANGYTYLKLYDNNTARSRIKIRGTGSVSVTADAGIITINSDVIPLASKQVAGIVKVGDNLDVNNGVVSVANNYVKINESQDLNNTQINRTLSNIGIEHVTKNSAAQRHCSRLAIGNTQILYGKSTQMWAYGSCRYCSVIFTHPFIAVPLVLGTPFITAADDNATCGAVGYSSSPRAYLFGIGSEDHVSRVFYGAIGQTFPLDENASESSSITAGTYNPIWIAKSVINLKGAYAYFLVDMFMTANSDSSNYIEFDRVTSNSGIIYSNAKVGVGETRLSHYVGYDGTHLRIGLDLDLSSNPGSEYDDVCFSGYSDKSDGKLYADPEFSTYMMRSFVVSVPTSDISSDDDYAVVFKFNQSLANGARGFIRVFYIPYSAS